MAILSNSWMQHLKSWVGNKEANKNMKAFSKDFAPATTVAKQVAALVEEIDAAVLLAGPDGTILRTHSWTKFGGTRSCASATLACLVGTGPGANVVIVDCSRAVVVTSVSIPSEIDITGCVTVQDLEDLAIRAMVATITPAPVAANPTTTPTPPTTATPTSTPAPTSRNTRSRNAQVNATATGTATPAPQANGRGRRRQRTSFATAATTQATTARNLELTSAFLMAPFLSDALSDERSAYPLELIILAREEAPISTIVTEVWRFWKHIGNRPHKCLCQLGLFSPPWETNEVRYTIITLTTMNYGHSPNPATKIAS